MIDAFLVRILFVQVWIYPAIHDKMLLFVNVFLDSSLQENQSKHSFSSEFVHRFSQIFVAMIVGSFVSLFFASKET